MNRKNEANARNDKNEWLRGLDKSTDILHMNDKIIFPFCFFIFRFVVVTDKSHCDTNGLVAAKVHDYSVYSTGLLKSTSQVRHAIQHVSNSSAQRQMDGSIAEHGKFPT